MVICSFHFKGLSANVQVYIATCDEIERDRAKNNIEKIYTIFLKKEQYKFHTKN